MTITNAQLLESLKGVFRDPLIKNSFTIILTSITGASIGVLFWLVAARSYPQEDVGIATALISIMGLLTLISRAGLEHSLIRYFPEKDKGAILFTSLYTTTILVTICGTIFIVGVDIWSPDLEIIRLIAPLFLLFLIANSASTLTGTAFIAIRKPQYNLIQSLTLGLRVPLLLIFVSAGTLGIFTAFGISFIFSLIASYYFLQKSGLYPQNFDRIYLRESVTFSSANYIAGLLATAPSLLLPILILNLVSAADTAYYYIVYSISSVIHMIPSAVSISLYVEGSHGEDLRNSTIKSIFAIVVLLFPILIIILLFGNDILRVFGEGYVQGFELLCFMTASALFISINQIFNSILKIKKRNIGLVTLGLLNSTLLLGLSYYLIKLFGMIGVGYAWLISSICCTGIILGIYFISFVGGIKKN